MKDRTSCSNNRVSRCRPRDGEDQNRLGQALDLGLSEHLLTGIPQDEPRLARAMEDTGVVDELDSVLEESIPRPAREPMRSRLMVSCSKKDATARASRSGTTFRWFVCDSSQHVAVQGSTGEACPSPSIADARTVRRPESRPWSRRAPRAGGASRSPAPPVLSTTGRSPGEPPRTPVTGPGGPQPRRRPHR